MNVPARIKNIVEIFDYNLETYKKGKYNETQVRLEYINPFFEELGWDVTNKQGYAEAYKDIIHEDAIKIGGVTKAPDYCFRIGGVRKLNNAKLSQEKNLLQRQIETTDKQIDHV